MGEKDDCNILHTYASQSSSPSSFHRVVKFPFTIYILLSEPLCSVVCRVICFPEYSWVVHIISPLFRTLSSKLETFEAVHFLSSNFVSNSCCKKPLFSSIGYYIYSWTTEYSLYLLLVMSLYITTCKNM